MKKILNRFNGFGPLIDDSQSNSVSYIFYDELLQLTTKYDGEIVTYIKHQDPNYQKKKIKLKWNKFLRNLFHLLLIYFKISTILLLVSFVIYVVFYYLLPKEFWIAFMFLVMCSFNFVVVYIFNFSLQSCVSLYHPHVMTIIKNSQDGTIVIEYNDNESFIHKSRVYKYQVVIYPDKNFYTTDLLKAKKLNPRIARGIFSTLQQAVMVGPN